MIISHTVQTPLGKQVDMIDDMILCRNELVCSCNNYIRYRMGSSSSNGNGAGNSRDDSDELIVTRRLMAMYTHDRSV